MTYGIFDVRITPHTDRPYTLELRLTRGSLAISGGNKVSFEAPVRPGGNLDRITDEPTLDFLLAIMRVKTIEWVSLTSTGALVRYSSEIDYMQCAGMLSYALRPPPDDPHPFLAEKVDICVESVLEGEELRLAGLMTDEEWLVVQRLRHDPAFLENVRRLLASLDGFVPPGVRAVGSPRYMAATTDPPADD